MTASHHSTCGGGLAVLLITGALLAPSAGAQARQDLRSPDARDAAGLTRVAEPAHRGVDQRGQDLRSPDSQDAGTTGGAQAPAAVQDLRSPDAVDAAAPPRSSVAPAAPDTRIVTITTHRFEWGAAAIGAAATLGLMLVLAGATFARTRGTAGHSTAS
jgi:hypothetical protein